MTVVCFAGLPASGKTTLSKALAHRTGWLCGGFGDYVRVRAQELGLGTERLSLQQLGQRLVEEDPARFCESVLHRLQWKPPENLILDGLRHVVVHDVLTKIIRPEPIYVVFVDIDSSLQLERLRRQGERSEPGTLSLDPTEYDVPTLLKMRADLVVNGADAPDATLDAILASLDRNYGANSAR